MPIHPAVLGLIILAGLIALALLLTAAWRLGRSAGRDGAAPFNNGSGFTMSGLVAAARARGRRVLAAGFAATSRRLGGVFRGADWRYTVPWVLLLGAGRSGRGTLAAAIDLHRPLTLPTNPDQDEMGCTWHVFDPGIVLEPADAVLWGGNERKGHAGGWRQLLNLLLRHRRERGIDGVVVTVSAPDLLARDPEAGLEWARPLRERLRELQQYLGLRVPVFLVVTKCDLVPGFSAFWQPLAAEHGRRMFGWSNDETLETSFGPHLIPRAFDELGRGLHRILLNQAVNRHGIEDLAFLFPAEFQKLADPVGQFADRLFHADAYQDPHFFRGVYFTGDVPVEPPTETALPAPGTVGSAPSGMVIDQVNSRPLFVTDLFSDKVFPEARLVQPARRGMVARGRSTRIRWGGLAALVCVMVLGTWSSYRDVRAAAQRMIPTVEQIATRNNANQGTIDLIHPLLDAFRAASGQDGRGFGGLGYPLLDAIRGGANGLSAPFLPTSWFSPIEEEIKVALIKGFDLMVLDPMGRELMTRAKAQLAIEPESPATETSLDAFDKLVAQIARLNKLADLVELYNLGSRLNADQLAWLVQTLLHVDVGDSLREDKELLAEVMAGVTVSRFDYGPWVAPARARPARRPAPPRPAARTIEPDGALVKQFRDLADLIQDTGRARFPDPLAAAAQLRTLDQRLRSVQQVLDAPNLSWRFVLHPERDAFWVQQLERIHRNPFLGEAAASETIAALSGKVAGLRTALLAIRSTETGPLLFADDQADGRLRLKPPLVALGQALPPLLAYDFLINPARQLVSPKPRTNLVLWAPAPLERAVAYEASFKEMEAGPLTRVPDSLRVMIKAVAAQALSGAMISAVADAEVLEKRGDEFRQFGDEEGLLQEARLFGAAAVPLVRVLEALKARGFDQAHAATIGVVGEHALAILEQADQLLEEGGLWMPAEDFRGWDGVLPMNFEGYQVLSDAELDQHLKTAAARVEWLATEIARPVVAALQGDAVPAPLRRNARVLRWMRILEDLERHKAGNPASSLSELERYIRGDLAAIKPGVCPEASADWTTGGRADYFSQRLRTVRALALAQCQRFAGEAGKTEFSRIATAFNTTLAGRYPFADGRAVGTPEVAPDAVVAFFEAFNPEAEARLRLGLGAASRGRAAAALQFIDRLAAVREFMAPLLAANTAAPPAFDIESDFRVNRQREAGGNQIIEWSLALGDQRLTRGGEAKTARWRPGEPVALKLRWAKDAPVAPVAVAGNAPPGAAIIDSDRALVASYTDQWGLIRLLQNHRAPTADLAGLVDRQPETLKFGADTGNVAVTDAARPAKPHLSGRTTVFVRVSVLALNPDGKTRRVLPLPLFPFNAPTLDGSP